MRIVVLDGHTVNPGDNPWDELARLGELDIYDRTAPAEILTRSGAAEIVVSNKTPLRAETLAKLPRLRFIAVLATGYDIVDVMAARARGVPVSNVPEYATSSVAQHVFALLLELAHHVGLHDGAVKAGEWERSADFCFWKTAPVELCGLRMGIVGLGRIGVRVAGLARAFGMTVIAAGRPGASSPGTAERRSIPDLFAEADVASLHCPLTVENAGFVNAELLRRMKPTAFLINTARGGLVNERDLAYALKEGWLAGAALDVVSSEPMTPQNPLRDAPSCIVTPHIAWASLAARRRLMATTVESVRAFLAGQPANVVN